MGDDTQIGLIWLAPSVRLPRAPDELMAPIDQSVHKDYFNNKMNLRKLDPTFFY